MQSRIFIGFIGLVLGICLLPACGDKTEGCLDIKAVNFNVAADLDCCCDYPDLLLNVQHVFDTLSFKQDSSYFYGGGDTFSIKEIHFLLSEVHPLLNGQAFPTDDTIQIGVNDAAGGELLVLEDNFASVGPAAFTYPLGAFPYPDEYDGLAIRAGVSETVNRIVPDSVYASGHPLSNSPDSLWSAAGGYFLMFLRVVPNVSNPNVEREIAVWSDGNMREFEVLGPVTATLGYDSNINVKTDYKILFDGINFETDSDNDISTKLSDNLPLSIQIID